jgi:hypothetical protein
VNAVCPQVDGFELLARVFSGPPSVVFPNVRGDITEAVFQRYTLRGPFNSAVLRVPRGRGGRRPFLLAALRGWVVSAGAGRLGAFGVAVVAGVGARSGPCALGCVRSGMPGALGVAPVRPFMRRQSACRRR